MAKVMATHTVGFAHGWNGNMNIVVAFQAAFVQGIGKALHFTQVATLAIGTSLGNL